MHFLFSETLSALSSPAGDKGSTSTTFISLLKPLPGYNNSVRTLIEAPSTMKFTATFFKCLR